MQDHKHQIYIGGSHSLSKDHTSTYDSMFAHQLGVNGGAASP